MISTWCYFLPNTLDWFDASGQCMIHNLALTTSNPLFSEQVSNMSQIICLMLSSLCKSWLFIVIKWTKQWKMLQNQDCNPETVFFWKIIIAQWLLACTNGVLGFGKVTGRSPLTRRSILLIKTVMNPKMINLKATRTASEKNRWKSIKECT